jgi:transposase-like protein
VTALTRSGGLVDGLKKALAERALNAELDHHLETGEPDGRTNGRNGYSARSVLTGTASSICRSRATGCRPSTRSSSPSTSGASPASTTRSCRCTPAA